MIWLLGGYLWLYIHRPFEYWDVLGAIQLERAYMITMIAIWLVWPGKGWVPNRVHLALVGLTLAIILSWLMSPYMGDPGCAAVIENTLKVSVFYLLVVTSVRDERGLKQLLALYLFAVGVYMGHSFWEYTNGRYQWRQGTTRMIGVDITHGDPNAFASTLVYALPLTLPFWWGKPRAWVRALLVGFTGLAALCILLTGSRAGFIGLCAAGFLALVTGVSRKFRAILLAGGAAAAGLLVLAVALPEDLQNRYLTLIDPEYGPQNAEVSASGRLAGFVEGIDAWQRSPLLGHGPAAFALATGREGQAHNLYGQTLSEVGLLGALALGGLVFCFWRNAAEARRLRRGVPSGPPSFAALVSWAVALNVALLLLMGWAGHNLYRYNWQWFAAFQAVALHCLRARALAWNARRVPYRRPSPHPAGRPRWAPSHG